MTVDKVLEIIRKRLQDDTTLLNRTRLTLEDVIAVLEKYLKGTHFLYKGEYYLQIHLAAMGSPISLIVCNIYMENFEQRAIASYPPCWWKGYVDDTCTVLKKDQAECFTEYLNTIDDDIKWATEIKGKCTKKSKLRIWEKKVEQCLAFLDTLSAINENGTIHTRVFRKETLTDQ